MSAHLLAQHPGIGSCHHHLIAFIVKTSDKGFPTRNVLNLIKVIGVLLTEKLKEAFLQGCKIFKLKVYETLIVKIEEEIFLLQLITQLLQQHRLSTSSYTSYDKDFRGGKPFLFYVSRDGILHKMPAVVLLLKYYLFQQFFHCSTIL